MSISRGLDLTRLRQRATIQSPKSRFITLILLLGLLGAIGLSLQLNWSSAAALGGHQANSNRLTNNTAAAKMRNGALRVTPTTAEPMQGCTVNCEATVPATGASGAPVDFNSTATAAGCATAPAFEWNFGDGSARSNQQNTTHTYAAAGTYTWTLTVSAGSGAAAIETVAGGLGEGNQARLAPFGVPTAIVRDPQGRGVYVADFIDGDALIRFINTTNAPVTVAGRTIEPGVVRALAGGGNDIGDNVAGGRTDLGTVTGLATSLNGNVLYFLAQTDGQVRALNVSNEPITVGNGTVAPGNIGTLASGLSSGSSSINGLAVNPANGEVFFADAAVGRVFRVAADGTVTAVAGNGILTSPDTPFTPGAALSTPLAQPRAVKFDGAGNLLIADTGHGRVISVDGGGNASLVNQFGFSAPNPNPYPSGLALQGGNLYSANGNQQIVVRVTNGVATVAGMAGTSCDYSVSNCGDGGPGVNAGLNLLSAVSTPPLAGIEGDDAGLFILDQGAANRGRVRYLNLSGAPVTVAGLTIAPGAIDTIAGNGLTPPYDGGLATSGTFSTPVGVAVDANGNLWVADTLSARLRFVNRSTSEVSIFAGTPAAQTVPAGGIVTVNKNIGGGATDGVPVTQAGFDTPQGLHITGQGLFIVDAKGGPTVPMTATGRRTSVIRFVNTSNAAVTFYNSSGNPITVLPGFIARIAGGGDTAGVNGDGGFALAARFVGASDIVTDASGNIYVADTGQNAVRKINGETGVVNSLQLPAKQYTGLSADAAGLLYIANFTDGTVLRENGPGAGTFSTLASGLERPRDIVAATDGSLYATVAPPYNPFNTEGGNHQIVQISSSGAVNIIAGSSPGFAGDGGPAASAQLNISPSPLVVGNGAGNQIPQLVGIALGPAGDVFFTDSNNNRIRRIGAGSTVCTRTGTITIIGDNPVPQLTGLNPTSVLAGTDAFTLTVTGSGFAPTSRVLFNGQERPTTFVSGSQLTAQILASDITTPGPATVTVVNPAPGGGVSAAVPLTIITRLTSISAASFLGGVAPESIVAGFGLNLATGVESATSIPLPTTLSGTRVRVRDSQGTERDAPLFFVAPSQINYLVPAGTAEGAATVTVISNNNVVGVGSLNVTNTAPSFFSANANGTGVAAAVIVRVKPDGTQTFEPVVRPEGSALVPIPIDLGPEGDQVIPIFYGTGFRNRANPTNVDGVRLTIGGVDVPVSYANIAPGFVGLDQVNAGPLPRSLAGRGVVDVVLSVDDKVANTVQLAIQ